MAYSLTYTFDLEQTGLSLESVILNTAGVQTVGTGGTNVEIGDGWYMVTRTDIPNDHRGALVVRLSGGGERQICFAINPQEAEYSDVATSDVEGAVTVLQLQAATDFADEGSDSAFTWTVRRGRYHQRRFIIYDSAGDPVDANTWSAWHLTAKRRITDPNSAALFDKTIGAGLEYETNYTIPEGIAGAGQVVTVLLATAEPADTESLTVSGQAFYELELHGTDPAGELTDPIAGKLRVLASVRRNA